MASLYELVGSATARVFSWSAVWRQQRSSAWNYTVLRDAMLASASSFRICYPASWRAALLTLVWCTIDIRAKVGDRSTKRLAPEP